MLLKLFKAERNSKRSINEETPCQIKSAEQLNGLMNLKDSDLLSKSLDLSLIHI